MGQLLLVWLMHVSWVTALSVHDIHLLWGGDLCKFTKFSKDNYLKSTSWSYKEQHTNTFDKDIFPQILTDFLTDLPQLFPEFAHIWHSAPCLRLIRPISLHYNSKPETIHSNLLSNITRHWVEAVDMIFFYSHHYNKHCTIENSAVVILCSLRHVSSMFDPGLVLFSRKLFHLQLSPPVMILTEKTNILGY